MANEVKRWKATMLRDDGNFQEIEVVDAKDHERIVAAKDAEIATLKKSLEDSMAQVMVAVHGETNTGWPHEKKLHETIAEQKRVIEFMKSEFQKLAKHETRVGASHVELSVVEAYRKLAAEVISEIETKLGMK